MLDLYGAATLKGTSVITTQKLQFQVSGAAKAHLEIAVSTIIGRVSGAGNCELVGSTKDLELELIGAGNFDASKLKAERASIVVSGAGEAKVHATEHLRATVSGAGSIIYKGEPRIKTINVTGAGSAKRVD